MTVAEPVKLLKLRNETWFPLTIQEPAAVVVEETDAELEITYRVRLVEAVITGDSVTRIPVFVVAVAF